MRSRRLDIGQVLFFCVFRDRHRVELHKLAKKERGQYPAILTEKNLVNKGFIIWLFGEIFLAEHAWWVVHVVTSAQNSSIVPARVANHSARFGSSCMLTELVMVEILTFII